MGTVRGMNRSCAIPRQSVAKKRRICSIAGRYGDNRPIWTFRPADGIRAAPSSNRPSPDETVSAQILHLVEWPDLRHAIVDVAVRRTGRTRRAGQPLLPHQAAARSIRRSASSGAGSSITAMLKPRAYRRNGMAGCITLSMSPPTEENYTPREWEKPHVPNMTGTPAAYRPAGLDAGKRPPSQGHRRLPALDARKLSSRRRCARA